MEADFRARYQCDLGTVCFGPEAWGLRKLYAHVRYLGADSATAQFLEAGWSADDELLATIAELLHAQLRAFLGAHGAKRIPDQLKIPRPSGSVPTGTPPAPMTLESVRSVFFGGVAQ